MENLPRYDTESDANHAPNAQNADDDVLRLVDNSTTPVDPQNDAPTPDKMFTEFKLDQLRQKAETLHAEITMLQRDKDKIVDDYKQAAWEIEDTRNQYGFGTLPSDPMAFARYKGLVVFVQVTAPPIIRDYNEKIAKLNDSFVKLDLQILSLEAIKF